MNPTLAGLAMLGAALGATLKEGESRPTFSRGRSMYGWFCDACGASVDHDRRRTHVCPRGTPRVSKNRLTYSLWRDEDHDPWTWDVWIEKKKNEHGAMEFVKRLDNGDADTWEEGKERIRETIESHGYSVSDAKRDFWG